MTLSEIKQNLQHWKLTKYKAINFTIAICSLLLYEFAGRLYYRPFIYENNINDFHIADTLGNTLGTATTIFSLIALFSNDTKSGYYFIKLGALSVVVFEMAHPLLGKPIDLWDIIATILTGLASYLLYTSLFKKYSNQTKQGS